MASTNPSLLMAVDQYQNWKFFNPSAVLLNSKTLNNPSASPKAQRSPVKMNKNESGKSLKSVYGASLLMSNNLQMSKTSLLKRKESDTQSEMMIPLKKKSKRGAKGSFVDQILQAAQETQDNELKDFFLTHVQTESVLPPIKLDDNKEYKNLMQRQKQVSYLVAKHVRLASERQKYGKVENNHYAHYEKLGPLECILQKVKPSEKTLNYQPRQEIFQKPSLDLMKTVNKKLLKEQQENGDDPMTKEFVQETYDTFGMNEEDIEDVNAIVAEEGDKIDYDSKEIKFTEHQLEFKNICSKVNKEKSAEIFIKTNKDFSKWNLRDKNSVSYFLSRAAMKEPRNFIEKEIEERILKNDEYFYRQKPLPIKFENADKADEQETTSQEEDEDFNEFGENITKIPKEKAWTESYQYYSETDRQSHHERDKEGGAMLIVQDHEIFDDMQLLTHPKEKRLRFESLSVGNQNRGQRRTSRSSSKSKTSKLSKIERQMLQEEEDKMIEEEKKKEEEELKKFIFLEKLKYEKAIKGYDRVSGLKSNIDDFTEVLKQKLFKKREPTNEFKYILKKDNTHHRIDHSKPLYMDDLKRFGKLKEVGDRKKLNLIEHQVGDLKRDFKDETIFNIDLDQQQMMQSLAANEISSAQLRKSQKKLKVITMKQSNAESITNQDKDKKNFSGAWYLPVTKWGNNSKYSYDQREIFQQEQNDIPKIGSLTKQALNYLLTPYTQTAAKKVKLFNKDDDQTSHILIEKPSQEEEKD